MDVMNSLGHTDFNRAFSPDEIFESTQAGRIPVSQVDVGQLVLPTGQIAACDPSYLQAQSDITAFTRRVAPGRYPVQLSVATVQLPGRTKDFIACAMVKFNSNRAKKWEMALLPDQDPALLFPGRYFGYEVDSGKGCFVDASVLPALKAECDLYAARLKKLMAQDKLWDLNTIQSLKTPFFQRLDKAWEEGRKWADVPVDGKSQANMIVFATGPGNGAYASYWGLDDKGKICYLVTDFGLLIESVEATVTFPLAEFNGKPLAHPELEHLGLRRMHTAHSDEEKKFRILLEGEDCFAEAPVIESGDNRYWNCAVGMAGNNSVYEYELDKPLRTDAKLIVKYIKCVRAL